MCEQKFSQVLHHCVVRRTAARRSEEINIHSALQIGCSDQDPNVTHFDQGYCHHLGSELESGIFL